MAVEKLKRRIALYRRVYFVLWIRNLKEIFSYKFDLVFGAVGLVVKNISSLLLLVILFNNIDRLGSYSFYEILLLQGVASISYGIWHLFFVNTITLPYYIKSGKYDHFLTKPLHPLFLILSDGFDEDGLGDLFYGIGLSIFALSSGGLSLGILFPLLLVSIFTSLIFGGISILGSCFSFFSAGYYGFADFAMVLYTPSKYPMRIFKKVQFIFYTLFPIGLVATAPLEGIVRDKIVFMFPAIALCGLIYFLLSCFVWNWASLFYEGTGS